MFHVERRFSEEIVRGWELFHVEHFGVTWVQYRRPCSTWNHPVSHVLPFLQNGRPINLAVRCAPQCSTWNGPAPNPRWECKIWLTRQNSLPVEFVWGMGQRVLQKLPEIVSRAKAGGMPCSTWNKVAE